jgi:hypothetical protein
VVLVVGEEVELLSVAWGARSLGIWLSLGRLFGFIIDLSGYDTSLLGLVLNLEQLGKEPLPCKNDAVSSETDIRVSLVTAESETDVHRVGVLQQQRYGVIVPGRRSCGQD